MCHTYVHIIVCVHFQLHAASLPVPVTAAAAAAVPAAAGSGAVGAKVQFPVYAYA